MGSDAEISKLSKSSRALQIVNMFLEKYGSASGPFYSAISLL
jgi:hypothetical protein